MKTAAVLIDAWKLPIFKKHLDEAKRVYVVSPGLTKDALTLTIQVKYEWVADIFPIIEAANKECQSI